MSTKQVDKQINERTKLKNITPFKGDSSDLAPSYVSLDEIVLSSTQPRRYFDPKAMQSLVESVKRAGILQALLIRPLSDEKYELVSGERRYRAAQECGLTEVPVIIREISDEQAVEYALTENLQREDLNPVEEVEGILQLLALKLKTDKEEIISLLNKIAKVKRGLADNVVRPDEQQMIEEVFVAVGKLSPESFRTHRLPILNLPDDILEALRAGRIEYTKAKEIAKLELEEDRLEFLEAAIELSLSLSQIREQVKSKKTQSIFPTLQSRLEATYKKTKKSKMWDNPEKCEKLESLLAEIEALLIEAD